MTELQKVSEETMRFMRGKYVLYEVAGKYYEIDCLKFRQGKKTIHRYIEERGAIPCGTTPLSCISVSAWGMVRQVSLLNRAFCRFL